jgi:hypothetical protein
VVGDGHDQQAHTEKCNEEGYSCKKEPTVATVGNLVMEKRADRCGVHKKKDDGDDEQTEDEENNGARRVHGFQYAWRSAMRTRESFRIPS